MFSHDQVTWACAQAVWLSVYVTRAVPTTVCASQICPRPGPTAMGAPRAGHTAMSQATRACAPIFKEKFLKLPV